MAGVGAVTAPAAPPVFSADEITAVRNIGEARDLAGVEDAAWEALKVTLGGTPDLRVLGSVPPAAIQAAIRASRIPAPTTGSPAATREIRVIEATQLGLLWRIARLKLGLPDMDPFTAAQQLIAAVKMSTVLDQGDDREGARPSMVDLGLAPYADFALFVNFQSRFSRALKFLNHVLQPDGTFRAVEVPGPPSFDVWLASWQVFANTLLMLRVEDPVKGVQVPVVAQSALDLYTGRRFVTCACGTRRCGIYCSPPRTDAGRTLPSPKRYLYERFTKGQEPDFDPATPWDM
ncbi:unnamed protein product, partial [Symbiodinium sp. CCMP2456]